MDRGAWKATVHGVAKELDMAELLNNEMHGYSFIMFTQDTSVSFYTVLFMKFRVHEASPGVHVPCDFSLLLRQTDSNKEDSPGMTAVRKLLSFYLAFGLWEGMFTLYHIEHQVQSWHCPDEIEGSQVVLHEGSKYFNG